jgi:hypothetical protein
MGRQMNRILAIVILLAIVGVEVYGIVEMTSPDRPREDANISAVLAERS